MFIKLIIAAVLLYFLFKWIHGFKKGSAATQKQQLVQLGLVLLAAALLVGVFTGKMHWVGAIIAGVLPFLRKGLFLATRIAPFWMQRTGGVARFKTDHLELEIDVARKIIMGSVIHGPHSGTALNQLTPEQLEELASYYQTNDKKSLFFIRALQKGFTEQKPPETFNNPDVHEAKEILGLTGEPSRDEIIKAHRRLINKLHPDRGGSDFLAARVNQARDVLLQQINHR